MTVLHVMQKIDAMKKTAVALREAFPGDNAPWYIKDTENWVREYAHRLENMEVKEYGQD